MKLTTTILILFVCFGGCKHEVKRQVVISGGGGVQSVSDSISGGIVTSIGQALIDKDGKAIDSIQGDLFYKCNYKYVQLGLYVDTTVWKEDRYDVVQIRVFLDRKKIFYTMFLNHPPEVWDADIDKEYLKSKLQTKELK